MSDCNIICPAFMEKKELQRIHLIATGGSIMHNLALALHDKGLHLRIVIETRNLAEVQQVLDTGGVDRIMLDNMAPDLMRQAVNLIGGRYETEASGGITEDNIAAVAASGVDYISVGALTHSVKSLDMSLKAF